MKAVAFDRASWWPTCYINGSLRRPRWWRNHSVLQWDWDGIRVTVVTGWERERAYSGQMYRYVIVMHWNIVGRSYRSQAARRTVGLVASTAFCAKRSTVRAYWPLPLHTAQSVSQSAADSFLQLVRDIVVVVSRLSGDPASWRLCYGFVCLTAQLFAPRKGNARLRWYIHQLTTIN